MKKLGVIAAVLALSAGLVLGSNWSGGSWRGWSASPAWAQQGHSAENEVPGIPALSLSGRGSTRVMGADINGRPKGVKLVLPAKFQALLDSYSIPGGDCMPATELHDPYPEFNGIAIDAKGGIVVMSDTNLKSALVYPLDVKAPPSDPDITTALHWVKGPNTFLSFAAGVAVDPVRHEFYTTENDVGDDVAAFPYGANGNFKSRVLAVPHGSYGIALSQRYRQMAVAIQHNAQIIFFRLQAHGVEAPVREIRGPHTGLADPHGVVWDEQHGEIFVSNYGNWNQGYWDPDYSGGGHYYPPSIRIFKDDGKGDVTPVRVISGPKTQFNWPTGIAIDEAHNELYVANEAGNQVLVFPRDANGNVAPIRVLSGPATQIRQPMGVAFDPLRKQLWVANFGHTAEVFDNGAEGNVAPVRLVRNAPEGTMAAGFGNPMALAYDSKRDELLVPN